MVFKCGNPSAKSNKFCFHVLALTLQKWYVLNISMTWAIAKSAGVSYVEPRLIKMGTQGVPHHLGEKNGNETALKEEL